jgi:dihydroneopterin aldolase
MATLLTSWAVAQEAGEAHSSIRVTNLQTSLPVAKDAWGRQGKLQPVLISASVSLREPFSSASSSDTVTNSTIHYGILSKAILESCQRCTEIFNSSGSANEGFTVEFLAQFIHLFLTHSVVQGDLDADYLRIVDNLVLPPKLLNSLELVIKLPKASLIGNAVSFRYHLTYKIDGQGPDKFSSVLRLHDLRIPTLVGVNSNERLAKQILVVNVELDPWIKEESYNELEEIVFKVPPHHFLPYPSPSITLLHVTDNRTDSRGVLLPDSGGTTFPPLSHNHNLLHHPPLFTTSKYTSLPKDQDLDRETYGSDFCRCSCGSHIG